MCETNKQNLRKTGSIYEEKASEFLIRNGVRILQKNYRTRSGEVDLIGMDGNYLVFFEVKYRKNLRFGHPLSAINARKRRQIIKTAQSYLYEKRYPSSVAVRFDCVVFLNQECMWVKNAFDAI